MSNPSHFLSTPTPYPPPARVRAALLNQVGGGGRFPGRVGQLRCPPFLHSSPSPPFNICNSIPLARRGGKGVRSEAARSPILSDAGHRALEHLEPLLDLAGVDDQRRNPADYVVVRSARQQE